MYRLSAAKRLRGEVTIPGDKSISHRAVMFSSIARGDTVIRNFLTSADCLSTMACFRKLGIRIEESPSDPSLIRVFGKGMHGLSPESSPVFLDTGNSGTTTRIMSGILAPQKFTSVLLGDDSLNSRPMKRIMEPLSLMGADIISEKGNGCAPLRIRGSALHGIDYRSKVASAQVKSAILCAGLYADGKTLVHEPSLSRDHTERMLAAFGADVKSEPEGSGAPAGGADPAGDEASFARILPADELYSPGEITVPGDISSAAYFIAAACLVPDAQVRIRNVGINPTRDGMLRAARAMGAEIVLENQNDDVEPCADLVVKTSSLKGTVIGGGIIPALIDELPVLAVMAALAEGETVIKDAAELKVKESDRIAVVTENLKAMGADITATDDGMIIRGGKPLHGALIHTYGDHRIAMSFAVAALAAEGETILDDETCCSVSYPSFFQDLLGLVEGV